MCPLDESAAKFGWANDPEKVRLDGCRAGRILGTGFHWIEIRLPREHRDPLGLGHLDPVEDGLDPCPPVFAPAAL